MRKSMLMFDLQRFNDTPTKESLLEFLKKTPGGEAYVVTIETMETAYRQEIDRKTTDNKVIRQKATDAEKSLKTLKENYSKVMTHLGIDEDTEDLESDLQNIASSKDANSDLQRKYDSLKKKYDKDVADKEGEILAERNKRHDLLKSNAVLTAITGKVHNPSEISKLILASVKVGDDDNLLFVGQDGKEISIEDGVKGWIANNTWAATNQQQPGGGSNGGKGGSAGGDEASSFVANLAQNNAKANQDVAKSQELYFK